MHRLHTVERESEGRTTAHPVFCQGKKAPQKRDKKQSYNVLFIVRSNIHFTEPNQCTRTRYLLMCEVIVGKQYKTWQHQPDFVSPPSGYDSVLGVKDSGGNHSMFQVKSRQFYITRLCALQLDGQFPDSGSVCTAMTVTGSFKASFSKF